MEKDSDAARNDRAHRPRLRRLAWLPIPIVLGATVLFWVADWQGSHESTYWLLVLNLPSMTLVCLFVAYLIARSFLIRATPGLLLLGCGVVIWGPAGAVATAVAGGDANISITIYNSCVWLSGLCHLAGVSLSGRPRRSLSPPALWLPGAYALAVGAVVLVALCTLAGWIPTFFVEARGGTLVRQVVLLSAVAMFALTALLLGTTRRSSRSAFAYWYALALVLIATGLYGVALQTHHASILGWTGRATQSLGGLYMLIAAVAAVRESRVWGISLEAALQQSEERYRALVETAPDAIVVHRDGRFLYANRAALLLAGADSFKHLACHTVLDFIPPVEREQVVERVRTAMAGDGLPVREAQLLRLDGQEVAVEFHTALVDFQGAPAVQTIIRDITERKQAEEALRKNQALVHAVIDGSPDLIYVKDIDGRVLMANPAACAALGRPPHEVIGQSARDFHSNDPEVGRAILENDRRVVESGKTETIEELGLNGRIFLSTKVPYRDADGHVMGLIGISHDITERKRAEEALRELNATLESKVAQRTAELEHRAKQLQRLTLELSQAEDRERKRIAALLHEDLQQHLAGTRFHLNRLRQGAGNDPQCAMVDEVDEMLKEAIEKSRSLCHDLSPVVLHMNDFSEVLRWLARQAQVKHGLTVRVDISGEAILPSEALTMFLFRVAREMLFNVAKHARVNEATIRVRRLGRCLSLSVSDRGCGFDPQDLKDTSGFGLLSIRERVSLLGGRMKIKSSQGRGSRFHIVIPDGYETEH